MRSSTTGLVLRYGLLVLLALLILLPFVSLVLAALHESGSTVAGLALPETFHWENFVLAWQEGGYDNLMRSSFIVALSAVPINAICAILAGFSLAVLHPWAGKHLSVFFVLGLTLPVELIVIALYFNLRNVGLTNNYLGVIGGVVALLLPFGVYWMQSHFSSMPPSLVEAGRIDGANDFTLLRRVLLPLSGPALTTLAVLVFMWTWNQFLLVIVLMQDPAMRTAPAGLGLFVGQYTTNIPLLAAATIITVAPIVIMYLIFQRNFISGISQGAIKE